MGMLDRLRLRRIGFGLVDAGMRRPRRVIWGAVLLTIVLGLLMLRVETDTDPENMLPSGHPVRVRNAELSEQFGSTNSILVGLTSDAGVVTPQFLGALDRLIDDVLSTDGVIAEGVISFRLASDPHAAPETQAEAEALAAAVAANELLSGFALSADGRGASVLVPLASKSVADDVADHVQGVVEADPTLAAAELNIAGLALAEERFGEQMFLQMALFAPLAGMLIFALMLYFFRKLALVVASMAVAMLTVIWTMGLMIGSGFEVHIMASMIPIFLMPIAILDSIHVLSEFFDRYPRHLDRAKTLRAVYGEVMMPITYTSLTTAVAFGSLAIAPIPPVQVFGLFVAVGVVIAWLLTLLFIPAFVMMLSEESLQRLAAQSAAGRNARFSAAVRGLGRMAMKDSRLAPGAFALLSVAALPGILLISVNDNPVRWFKSGSEVRQATATLNETFGGTFSANLLLSADDPALLTSPGLVAWVEGVEAVWSEVEAIGTSTTYVGAIRSASEMGSVGATQVENDALLAAAERGPTRAIVGSLIAADRRAANLQLRMSNGDNKAMAGVIAATDGYLAGNPLPSGINAEWAGETFLNLVWQDKMVSGMLSAFLTTLGIVFVLMVLLFRSLRWAVVAIVPLAGAIVLVYGIAGFVGKEYDMPMAVLSTLVLGIGIDFAIHFIQRYRALRLAHPTSAAALTEFFEEPARALTRNAVIIALGFIPMLFASLVPYIIVGVLLLSIMALSWLATVVVLPGVVALFDARLPRHRAA